MRESIAMLDKFKNKKFIIIYMFFISIILFLSLSGYTFLGVQDEVQLQSTLMAGDPRNFMMSYPLNLLISLLYTQFPAVPWYSILMLLYISLISFLMSIYIVKSEYDKYLKYILLLLFTLLLIYLLFDVTVTVVCLTLIVLAVPLIHNHQVYFWILVFLASLLRVEMIVNLSPLFLLAYLIFVKKPSFNSKKTIVILFLLIAISFNYLSSSFDKEYKEWLHFQQARIYFNDKKGTNKKHILTEDEFKLAHSWWICDLGIYPADKIIQAANSNIDVMLDTVFTKSGVRRAIGKTYRHKILILLILLTIYILYLEKNNLRRSYYILFAIGFFSLILVKDQQRTTVPLIILWCTILFPALLKNHKENLSKVLLLFLIVYIASVTPWTKVTRYQQNEKLVHEFKDLANRNSHMKLETSSGFSTSWGLTQTVLEQNHLLHEKDGVYYDNDNLVLAQWFVLHPMFFEQHDISFKNIKRKYSTYYEYLLDDNTGVIGSKDKTTINPFLAGNLLRIYDTKFAEKGCHHEVKTLDESEHFLINAIVKVCDENTSDQAEENSR